VSTKVEISKRLVFINSLSGVATKVLNIAVLVWLYRYLLKRISTEEYALYPVLASLIAFLPLSAKLTDEDVEDVICAVRKMFS